MLNRGGDIPLLVASWFIDSADYGFELNSCPVAACLDYLDPKSLDLANKIGR
jgi:hypothetical protein